MSTIPEDIIIRYFQQTATEEESRRLHEWLKEDNKNVELFYQLEEMWSSRHKIDEAVIRKGWERLHAEMQPEEVNIPFHSRKRIPVWVRYAAAACIGVLVALTVWLGSDYGIIGFGQPVVQNVVFNRNGVELLILPDSSEVWINANSKLTYPEKFSKKERLVVLEGNAYFDIRKNSGQPFKVQVNDIEVEVTGTEFFIESTAKKTQITLISGGIDVKRIDKKYHQARLTPGQEATIFLASNQIDVKQVDVTYYIAWKDGIYRFEEEPLEKIAGFLARHFNMDIKLDETLKTKRFTGRVSSDDEIQSILNKINLSIPVHYEINDNIIIIRER